MPTTALTVSPAILEYTLSPGVPIVTQLVLENQTNTFVPITAYVANLTPSETLAPPAQLGFDASAWFSLSPADFILGPYSDQKITVAIEPPSQVEPGGHYATIYFEPLLPETISGSAGTTSHGRVGVLVFLTEPGTMSSHLTLSPLHWPSTHFRGPLELELKLENSGNVHVSPTGSLQASNFFRREAASFSLPPTTILPGSSRPLPLTWDPGWQLGPFQISGSVSYGHPPQTLEIPAQTIWLLPWSLLLTLLILLTSIVWFVIVGRSRLKLAWKILRSSEDGNL